MQLRERSTEIGRFDHVAGCTQLGSRTGGDESSAAQEIRTVGSGEGVIERLLDEQYPDSGVGHGAAESCKDRLDDGGGALAADSGGSEQNGSVSGVQWEPVGPECWGDTH